MNIVLMSFGSRGDIQPFLALAIALRERGHGVTFAALQDFEAQIGAYQIPFIPIPISMKAVLEEEASKRIVREGMTIGAVRAFWREVMPKMRLALRSATEQVTEAARGAELLISHVTLFPFAYSIHQHLGIPLVLAAAAPIVPTRAFASPMFPPLPWVGRVYNRLTYHGLLRLIIGFESAPMNAYRREVGLPTLSTGAVIRVLFSDQFPILLHYSRHLLAVPPDWGANVQVTGAWTMPPQPDWTAPPALAEFLTQGDPPVFFGFGSMKVAKPEQMVRTIREALRLTGLRGVLQAGWSDMQHDDAQMITIGDAPHDWLFPRMAAIVHHGGSGTTHSAARAGKPMLIVPFMADQPFWGRRVAALGIGVAPLAQGQLTAQRLAAALRTLTTDSGMRQRADEMGARLRDEDGLAVLTSAPSPLSSFTSPPSPLSVYREGESEGQ
jgi:sterol 3beta-glucosyltransferase